MLQEMKLGNGGYDSAHISASTRLQAKLNYRDQAKKINSCD
jgi:hypothetical protein